MTVSIVIPAFNAQETLASCLESVLNLDFPKDKREIIVVDNHSTDATREIIKRYPVKYAFVVKRGRSRARNKGVQESEGEIVAFLDADCVVDKYWLKHLIQGFNYDKVGGCGGKMLAYQPNTLLEQYLSYKQTSNETCFNTQELLLPFILTRNAAYRRDVLEKIGYFDDCFITNEDVDLSWRIYLSGYQLQCVPEAIIYYKHSDKFIQYLIKCLELGCTQSYLTKKYQELFKIPMLGFRVWQEFLLQQAKFNINFLLNLFSNRNNSEKFFPALGLLINSMVFLGRLSGAIRVMLGREKIDIQPNPDKFLWRMVNGKVVISEAKRDSYYVLDAVGTKIWTLLTEKKTICEIIESIADEYKTDKERVKTELLDFVTKLKEEGLIFCNVGGNCYGKILPH